MVSVRPSQKANQRNSTGIGEKFEHDNPHVITWVISWLSACYLGVIKWVITVLSERPTSRLSDPAPCHGTFCRNSSD